MDDMINAYIASLGNGIRNTAINKLYLGEKEKNMNINEIFNFKLEKAVLVNGHRIDNGGVAALITLLQSLNEAFDKVEALDLDAEVVQNKLIELEEAIHIVTEILEGM